MAPHTSGTNINSKANIPTKCPCCKNPWSSGEFLARMACVTCGTTTGTTTTTMTTTTAISRSNLDESADKTINFYKWANGGWMRQNPIPPGYPSWDTFTDLHVKSQEQCRDILNELIDPENQSEKEETKREESTTSSTHGPTKEDKNKIALLYQAALDEEAVEAAGVAEALSPILHLVDQIVQAKKDENTTEYAKLLGKLAALYDVHAFFQTSASPDSQNAAHTLCQLSQGGLGLPDRDYYMDNDDENMAQYKRNYQTHVANMLRFVWNDDKDDNNIHVPETAAQSIVEWETILAQAHMTRTENRDPHATYNKMTLRDLGQKVDDGTTTFDFEAYFVGATAPKDQDDEPKDLGEVNVCNVQALLKAAHVAATMDAASLRAYLTWHVLHSYASYLPKVVVDENFDFFERQLSGTTELKPRWKRAMEWVESSLGEILGQLYCARHFEESSCKQRALDIVHAVRAALEARLHEVEWITSDETRAQALQKMNHFRVKIGYPNEWIDYSSVKIHPGDSLVSMIIQARAAAYRRTVNEMNAPTNREKWFLTPQTVDAYFHPNLNEIAFPAAILQSPFFDPNADDAVNYGSMGAVVGHEMTHGYDDEGRKFNYEGILHDWWTPEDATEYEQRVAVMVQQANDFHVHGKPVQGKLTSGENIADLGGLRLALRAFKETEQYKKNELIDGFTPLQRFFLAWAQCWRQNITSECALQLLTLDPHGPMEMRCNGPVSNMPEFHDAFEVPEGSPMWRAPELRVDIW